MNFYGVRLLVKDFRKCFKFYAEEMGFICTWGSPDSEYASFNIGEYPVLSLFKSDLMAPVVGNVNLPLPENCREKSMIVIGVEDVDKTYEEFQAKGINFVAQPVDMPAWGMRCAYLRDPEGNLIELFSPLSRDKWDAELVEESKKYE